MLAVTDGGQVTRAKAIIESYQRFKPSFELIILKREESLDFVKMNENYTVINVKLWPAIPVLRPWKRLLWENLYISHIIKKYYVDIYLTFSHYLPWSMPKSVFSVVGVTNLAPFSHRALSTESLKMRIKMKILKIGVINSSKRANQIIALSKYCKKVLENNGISPEKITVISNGVPKLNSSLDSDKKALEKFGVKDEFILYVSSFFRYKKFDTVISAFAELQSDIRNKYQLVFIGAIQDRDYYNELKNQIDVLGLHNKVIIIDAVPRNELNNFYINTRLFIFASLIENCPNILLEALSFGCPIISSSEEPMPEFGGDAIEYFDPESSKELTNKIKNIINSDKKLDYLSRMSKERSKLFSWEKFANDLFSLLQESN